MVVWITYGILLGSLIVVEDGAIVVHLVFVNWAGPRIFNIKLRICDGLLTGSKCSWGKPMP